MMTTRVDTLENTILKEDKDDRKWTRNVYQ
jgi:hypothetical protein